MVDFEQMLDNLMQVERTGFNPYTQAYSAALEPSNDPSGTQQPFGGESGLKESSRVPMAAVATTNISSTPQTTQPTSKRTEQVPSDQSYSDAWYEFGSLQADLVDQFAEKYPDIPIYDIARETKDIENWSNEKLDKYYKQLEKKYGKAFLEPDEVDDRWYEVKEILRYGDANIAENKANVSTRGTKESTGREKVSFRNLLERRMYPGQKEPYQYLYDEEAREDMRWKSQKDYERWKKNLSEEDKARYFKGVNNKYDNVFMEHKDVPFVKRIMDKDTSSIQIQGEKGRSSHFMTSIDNYVVPQVQKEGTKLKYYENYHEALKNAIKNKNYIKFDTPEEAEDFAKKYKNSDTWKEYENSGKW